MEVSEGVISTYSSISCVLAWSFLEKNVLEKQNQFLGCLTLFEAFLGILASDLVKD